jgi:DNA polymerase elongation subunit (family B)
MKEFIEQTQCKTCESSLSEDIKFLQKRYGDKDLKVDMDDFQICSWDIELASEEEFPDDIAENPIYPINLISAHYSKDNSIHTFGLHPYTGDDPSVKNYHHCATEAVLLESFIRHFRRQGVDILTGWYADIFDVPYFINRCKQYEIELSLSPINIYKERFIKDKYDEEKERQIYQIAGVSILDGKALYENFTYKNQVSYSLNNIGMVECGEGKIDLEGQINHIYKTDWNKYVEYNVQDVKLTYKIERKKRFMPLVIEFCYQALIPFDSVFSSIRLITGFMLRYCHKKNIVFPDPPKGQKKARYPGGYVMNNPGLYEMVMSFDVESLYPHLIMMYNISPETLVLNPKNTDGLYRTPASKMFKCSTPSGDFEYSGIYYKSDKKGILPEIIEDIFNSRKYNKNKMKVAEGKESKLDCAAIAKNTYLPLEYVEKLYGEVTDEGQPSSYYDNQQMIRKILINSMYGVLGNRFFAFYNISNAAAITVSGRHLIKFLSEELNKYMKQRWHLIAPKFFPKECEDRVIPKIKKDLVILIDTDSNYVTLKEVVEGLGLKFETNDEFRIWSNEFDKNILTPFFTKILDIYSKNYKVPQMINFKREKIISKMIIIKKKKYAVLTLDNEGKIYKTPKMNITGIETVKSDTPKYCQKHLDTMLYNILDKGDRVACTKELKKIYDGFMEANIDEIAKPKSVNGYTKYAEHIDYYKRYGVRYKSGCPQQVKAAINYNYIINKYGLSLQPIGNGGKVKFVKIKTNNEMRADVIGFIGTYPKEFETLFRIDMKEQWDITFKSVLQRFYDVIGWGEVKVATNSMGNLMRF